MEELKQEKRSLKGHFMLRAIMCFVCVNIFAGIGICGAENESEEKMGEVFLSVAQESEIKGGVREITYDQFMMIRNSGEDHMLLDVLSADSYAKGHIEGAVSFPFIEIDEESAQKRLSKDDHIIVYCGSFQCAASSEAARTLSELGYNVLDYKGGLKEWQEKGNSLIS
jgi:rhodanese-related sulfurtransferase